MTRTGPVRFGVVGSGWRAEYFVRLARTVPHLLECTGVVARREEAREAFGSTHGVPMFATADGLVDAAAPEFVISSVPYAVHPEVIDAALAARTPVLCETPPAGYSAAALREFWTRYGATGQVQVAEQNNLLPMHAARLEAARRGVLGEVTSVQMSSQHMYHAMSLVRHLLGVGFEPTRVSARRFTAPLVDLVTKRGPSTDPGPHPRTTTVGLIEFSGGASAVYDFTENQWHNHLRSRRMVVRGSHGEIVDDRLVRVRDDTIVESRLLRHQSGYDLDLEGYDTQHISLDGEILWRNPFAGLRLPDEEIAILTQLCQMADWVRGTGPEPYPLAQACEDHLICVAVEESADDDGRLVTTGIEPWSDG